jgi:hypothetical protein
MALRTFDRETLLDALVNIIPLAIIGFFALLFVVQSPWGLDTSLATLLQFGMLAVWAVLLAVVTYLTAERI